MLLFHTDKKHRIMMIYGLFFLHCRYVNMHIEKCVSNSHLHWVEVFKKGTPGENVYSSLVARTQDHYIIITQEKFISYLLLTSLFESNKFSYSCISACYYWQCQMNSSPQTCLFSSKPAFSKLIFQFRKWSLIFAMVSFRETYSISANFLNEWVLLYFK